MKVFYKAKLTFVQMRWGYDKLTGEKPEDAEWKIISEPFDDFATFLQEFEFTEDSSDVVGLPFPIKIFEG